VDRLLPLHRHAAVDAARLPRTLTFHLLIAAVALLYVAWLAVARRLPGGTPLDLAVLALAAAYAAGTAASLYWRVSLEATLQLGAAAIVFYVLSDLPALGAAQLRRAFMLVGVALSLYTLWVVGNDYANYLSFAKDVEGLSSSNIFPPTVPRAHDVSDHPNVLAMLLTLFMPMFTLSVFRAESRWERLGGLGALLAGAMAIFLTLSRGGWIGVGTGVTFTIVGGWVTVRWFEREQRGEPASWQALVPAGLSPTAIAAIGGAIVLVVGGTLAFLASASTRPGWLFRSSLSPREDAWRAGYHMFRDHPLFGAGPDVFGLLYAQYAHGNFLVHTQHAHNGFLQVADDAGILGIAALLVVAASVAFVLYRTWRGGSLDQRLLAVARRRAARFSAHNQLDAGNIWKAPAIALAIVGAIIARNYREAPGASWRPSIPRLPERWQRYGGFAARALVLLLLMVPLAGWYRIDRAHYDYWQGLEKWNKGEPGAIEKLQAAVNADSSMMVYQLQLGQAQATAFNSTGKKDRSLLDNAIIHLERAVQLDYRSDLAHANLARAYQLAGRDDDAAAEAQKTRVIARYHVPPVLLAAEVYEDIGRTDDAIDTYGQVISMDSGLADSQFWQDTAFRRDNLTDPQAPSLGLTLHRGRIPRPGALQPGVLARGPGRSLEGLPVHAFASFPDDLVLRVSLAKILMQQDRPMTPSPPGFRGGRADFARRAQSSAAIPGAGNLEEARHQWVVGASSRARVAAAARQLLPPARCPPTSRRLQTLLGGSGTSIQNDVISVLLPVALRAAVAPAGADSGRLAARRPASLFRDGGHGRTLAPGPGGSTRAGRLM
jgi:putative inorganic carbon (HCO3(-)) transporter